MYKIKFRKLDHLQICIPTNAEDKARAFYSDIIGLMEIQKPEALTGNRGLWFEIGDIQLHIGTEDELNESKRHPAFEVEELPRIRNYLEENGIKIKDEIPIPGQSRFSFRDPFGNRIEFLEKEISPKSISNS